MKTTMITTVLNEEKNIEQFLNSVIHQTKKLDEFIIVDGGSKDNTLNILKDYSKKYRWIKIFQVKGANIAEGRNYAIKKSKGDIIFTSDSSTLFEKDWVKKILKGFEKGADVVFGKYTAKAKNLLEKFLILRLPNWNKINPDNFLPSNRHVAFKKEVWQKVKGFPNHIIRADDNWFHSKAHKLGFKYYFAKDTKTYWKFDRNLKTLLRLAFLDSKSEGFSGLFIERKIYFVEMALLTIAIISLFTLNFFTLLKLILLGILILFIYLYAKSRKIDVALIGLPLIPLLYLSHVFGVIGGIIQRIYKEKE